MILEEINQFLINIKIDWFLIKSQNVKFSTKIKTRTIFYSK